MYVIVGLGNPTYQYAKTRHNVGFEVIDELAERNKITMDINKHKAVCGKGMIAGQKVVLVQPQTYMNLSGESVRAVIDFYKIDPKNELIVIFDDISLDVGQIRLRASGSPGGHNGIKSIALHLGNLEFPRIKVGVGDKPSGWDLADYVLGRFNDEERTKVDESIVDAAMAAELFINEGVESAMNRFNGKK
ncbi:MAG: aminoacyl-tRNA hydrolase [Clostridiales bacterium]|nr:aminoacyl-tRNA hydrolase [Clostridiales bacterium]